MEELFTRNDPRFYIRDFELGRVEATPGAKLALEKAEADPEKLVQDHANGFWGDVDVETYRVNFRAAATGEGELFSVQRMPNGERVWIITDWSRTTTTVMLPNEYAKSDLFTIFTK